MILLGSIRSFGLLFFQEPFYTTEFQLYRYSQKGARGIIAIEHVVRSFYTIRYEDTPVSGKIGTCCVCSFLFPAPWLHLLRRHSSCWFVQYTQYITYILIMDHKRHRYIPVSFPMSSLIFQRTIDSFILHSLYEFNPVLCMKSEISFCFLFICCFPQDLQGQSAIISYHIQREARRRTKQNT